MTIGAGREWGVEVDAPAGPWVLGGTRELAGHVESGSDAPFALTRGCLFDVLGRPAHATNTPRCRCLPLDMIDVEVEFLSGEREHRLATDVIVRGRRFRGTDLFGEVVVVSNCGQYRGIEFSVRGHPNDGRLEMLRVSGATVRERLIAFSRARSHNFQSTATVRVNQTANADIVVPRGHVVLVDGTTMRNVKSVRLAVAEDRASVYIGVQ